MTAIFDVIVDNPELSVLGPPSQIDVAVDIGQQGIRGSKIFSGNGEPSTYPGLSAQNPLSADLYINTAGGANYGWMYKYDGTAWNSLLRLQTPLYSTSYDVTCSAGTGTVTVALSNIIPADMTTPSADNFIVTMTCLNANPVVFSIVDGSKAISGITDFQFNITARVFNPSASGYSNLFTAASGILTFDLRITVV